MINEKMYDLGIELLDDGNINLEQDAGYGEMSRITLHPSQLRLIAERTGLLDFATQAGKGKSPDITELDRTGEKQNGYHA